MILTGRGYAGRYGLAVEQEIRFLEAAGERFAVAASGAGPPLVLTCWWMGDLEALWKIDGFRAFVTALGRGSTVIRFDRLRGADPLTGSSLEHEQLAAIADDVGGRISLLGASSGGASAITFAAARPDLVERVVLYGSFARGDDITTRDVRESLVALVRAHWGLGSRALADVYMANATTEEREAFAAYQRRVADADEAAEQLHAVYAIDVASRLGEVSAPTLVLHRRSDRAIPFELGRQLAAGIPGARLVPLEGRAHFPWIGDHAAVQRPLLAFLGADDAPRPPPAASPLSEREREVLSLVALGMSDDEIADHLVLSPHTVHRHVANVRRKLGQPSRAAAVAEAARLGLL
jgi:DNA-binding CsgD family transcriptional regulator/pimeloyl-ACP methyl ester carboxylesterase